MRAIAMLGAPWRLLRLRLVHRTRIGRGVRVGRHLEVAVPGGTIALGDGTRLGDRCVLSASANPHALIEIGNSCTIDHDVHVCATREIRIGNGVCIGARCSIRDSMHNFRDRSRRIDEQGDRIGRLTIEDDVRIGEGCLVLGTPAGVVIGRGAHILPGSVVRDSVAPGAVVGGAPARRVPTAAVVAAHPAGIA